MESSHIKPLTLTAYLQLKICLLLVLANSLGADYKENTSSCIVARWVVAAETCLQCRRQRTVMKAHTDNTAFSIVASVICCRRNVFIVPLPSNDSLFSFHCFNCHCHVTILLLMASQNYAGHWVLATDTMKLAILHCFMLAGINNATS
jgi:hypothetical protein